MDGCGGYARKIKGTENECLRWKSTACIKAKLHACTTRLGSGECEQQADHAWLTAKHGGAD